MSDHESSTFVLTLSFYTCLSFQKSTVHSVFFGYNSGVQSFFHTNFQPSPLFSVKISNSASTVARTTVFCLYSAHVRLPLREPPGLRIECCLNLEGHLFWSRFFEPWDRRRLIQCGPPFEPTAISCKISVHFFRKRYTLERNCYHKMLYVWTKWTFFMVSTQNYQNLWSNFLLILKKNID